MSDKRLYGIDLFKALAMFLVVVLHVNTLGTVVADRRHDDRGLLLR